MDEQFLTSDDLASLFRVNRRTLDRWVSEGVIPPPLRFGGTRRWLRSQVFESVQNRTPAMMCHDNDDA